MFDFERRRWGKPLAKEMQLSITFDQRVFKKNITSVMSDLFVMTMIGKKRIRVTQSKRFPRPQRYGQDDVFSLTHPIGWR